MAKRLKNNLDLVKDLMTYSPYGGLSQAFIIQGIQYYCEKVLEDKEKLLKEQEENEKNGKIGIVSNTAWVGLAEDVKKRMEEFYSNNK